MGSHRLTCVDAEVQLKNLWLGPEVILVGIWLFNGSVFLSQNHENEFFIYVI